MQSVVIGMLMPEGSEGAALLVRRADGQFAFERVDVRLAWAARAAARWSRRDAGALDGRSPPAELEMRGPMTG